MQALRGIGDAGVIAIDQLEELVTLCDDLVEREVFAAAVIASGARIVALLRDDFATVLESLAAFRGRFEVFVLATPPSDELRKILVDPMRRAGVVVDPRVVDDVVAEIAGRPASLPLLSFTAARLWQTRTGRRIDHAAYTALGGVAGALATYSDQVYAS